MTRRADFRSLGTGYVRVGEAPPKVLRAELTATLANSPVSCSGTDQGVPFTTTVTRYTLVTTDGHNMSVDTAATVLTGGQNCSLALAGTLKR